MTLFQAVSTHDALEGVKLHDAMLVACAVCWVGVSVVSPSELHVSEGSTDGFVIVASGSLPSRAQLHSFRVGTRPLVQVRRVRT
eukprot:COSAG05_NODE_71_length_22071_cov_17.527149_10_plen_84_part_00